MTEGCSLESATAFEIACTCNHMTDFTTFLKTAGEVATGANWDVWMAMQQLDFQTLAGNLGFYLGVVYWVSLVFLVAVFELLDRKETQHGQFEQKLFQAVFAENKYQVVNKDREHHHHLETEATASVTASPKKHLAPPPKIHINRHSSSTNTLVTRSNQTQTQTQTQTHTQT